MTQKNWWKTFYTQHFAEIMLASEPSYLESARSFMFRHLRLQPGQRVFDQCCGIGNLSLTLAEAGLQVYGIDQSEAYILEARKRAQAAGLACEFEVADAFEFILSPTCDAAINWHTSFGYTPDDRQNRRMLDAVFASLRPGGYFLLDFINLPYVLQDFRATMISYHPSREGEVQVQRDSELDLKQGLMTQTWRFRYPHPEKNIEIQGATRLYLPYQLGDLLQEAGFEVLDYLGGLDDQPLSLATPRCICLARKPEDTH
ncbi:hypothetical protein COW36_11920 [bacterium (Candidatus Blackallbacteria) CG17_big_fil_post_rev_8_21_14_2_50_48_46]|uniref:Methyltransferase domain-containing protein n=1 Tax=bacterium (Candidatus Blackallbacteria) CG17_big_fil_post_rev_8_21_14_2_50_48_46 TaxID=2014261 RepID=A0A2M7G3L9_9BACT|nr:MAG: hypothetical protein COW64_03340 [bacterium (Candidatus Blackallbacteria) CG18_big_fil_WC_8_21_14_2_50_49_26]PIW16470.1 MAG: hypothetical protein COW36_11920 [bacterium (Candidatus Blackallbacteria) CG17_big_fil_post_rev_8_21_14_2_50_48_46]PIW45978.1 MAG: hypothetical protein COW20_17185 [bacterium (Candidatus Blackallbacteria) CG13_big_fil_rev_8_21_14_2_50_49_14]